MNKLYLITLAFLSCFLIFQESAKSQDIYVYSIGKYQTISGWEVTAQAGQDYKVYDKYKDTLLDLAVNTLGLNRLRLEVKSGSENSRDYWDEYNKGLVDYATYRGARYSTVNDNDDPNNINWDGFKFSMLDSTVEKVVLPFRERVEKNGEKFRLNINYVAFTAQIAQGLKYDHTNPEEYAEFVLATCLHLKNKYNLVPDYWEVILEPDNTAYWRGKTIGQSIIAAAKRLKDNGFDIKFIAPSTTNMANAPVYFEDMIKETPDAMQYISELSYHRYSGVSFDNLGKIRNATFPNGKKSSMLEWIGADYTTLFSDLTVAYVSAWQQYTLAFPGLEDNGGKYFLVDTSIAGKPLVKMGKRTPYLAQFFKYIREGAQRIDADPAKSGLYPVAFINKNGDYVLVTVTDEASNFTVAGLPDGLYGITYTTDKKSNEALPDAEVKDGGSLEVKMPGKGVVTVYAKKTVRVGDSRTGSIDISVSPNPASDMARLNLTLPQSAYFSLSLYSSIGEEVASVASGYYEQGSYTFDLSAGNLADGVYYYRLRAGSVVKTGCFVVAR